jgi:hypothetical protein
MTTAESVLADQLQRINMRLAEVVDLLTDLSAKLGTEAQTPSSVEIKTSTRGTDVAVKSYVGSDVTEAGNAAMAEYARVVGQINQKVVDAINNVP